jgi:hypothetical protein
MSYTCVIQLLSNFLVRATRTLVLAIYLERSEFDRTRETTGFGGASMLGERVHQFLRLAFNTETFKPLRSARAITLLMQQGFAREPSMNIPCQQAALAVICLATVK